MRIGSASDDQPLLTKVIEDAGLLILDVLMSHSLAGENLSPANREGAGWNMAQDTRLLSQIKHPDHCIISHPQNYSELEAHGAPARPGKSSESALLCMTTTRFLSSLPTCCLEEESKHMRLLFPSPPTPRLVKHSLPRPLHLLSTPYPYPMFPVLMEGHHLPHPGAALPPIPDPSNPGSSSHIFRPATLPPPENSLFLCLLLPGDGDSGFVLRPHRDAALQVMELAKVLPQDAAAFEVPRHIHGILWQERNAIEF